MDCRVCRRPIKLYLLEYKNIRITNRYITTSPRGSTELASLYVVKNTRTQEHGTCLDTVIATVIAILIVNTIVEIEFFPIL